MSVPSTDDLVRRGAELWDVIRRSTIELEKIKDLLRDRVPDLHGTHTIAGAKGASCQATVQGPQTVVRRDVTARDLREDLGKSFDLLFEVSEVLSLREGFEDALTSVDRAHALVALAAVDQVSHKARLSFRLGDR